MTIREFSVGDRVRVRQWDDMAREFGVDGDSIRCNMTFLRSMKDLCGKEFTITRLSASKGVYGHDFQRYISTDMIEHVEEDLGFEIDNTEVNKFLEEFCVS